MERCKQQMGIFHHKTHSNPPSPVKCYDPKTTQPRQPQTNQLVQDKNVFLRLMGVCVECTATAVRSLVVTTTESLPGELELHKYLQATDVQMTLSRTERTHLVQ